MASHTSLGAAAQERKERLAKLRSLKRKEPDSAHDGDDGESATGPPEKASKTPGTTTTYLSGRNYDFETRGPKLGFENAPDENVETLEDRAEILAAEAKKRSENEAKEDQQLDLFKLQPKKPNWDLKRDLDKKMERLNTRTNNAISRLVKERIEEQQQKAKQNGNGAVDGDAVGMEGGKLAMHVREMEEQEEARREREVEEEDGS